MSILCILLAVVAAVSIPAPSFSQGIATRNIGSLTLDEFKIEVVTKINEKRALHGAPPVERSAKLDAYAQNLADQLAATNWLEYTEPYGVSSYAYYWYNYRTMTPSDPVDRWYNEYTTYDYSKPEFQFGAGSFTQMVWKSSRQIGIGMAQGIMNSWRVVAVYDPPGNVAGQFQENVGLKSS